MYKPLKSFGDIIYSKLIINKLKKINFLPDIVLSHLPRADRVAKRLPYRKYFFIHTSYLAEVQKFSPRRASRKARLYKKLYEGENVVTVSRAMESDFAELDIQCKSIQSIYNPFDEHEIRSKADMFNPEIKGDYIIYPNAFRTQKRYDIMFKALQKIKSPITLVILSEKTQELNDLIKEFKVSERVNVLGFQKNPFPYFKHAKLTVLSSDREGLPTVLVESLILGTPVVSTDCPTGPREILKDSLSQWLVPVGDSDTLARKIDEALDANIKISESHIEDFLSKNIINQYKKLLL